jgi:hypothetical protein
LLGAGLEMIFISSERLRALAMEGAAILGMDDGIAIAGANPQRETLWTIRVSPNSLASFQTCQKNRQLQWLTRKDIHFFRD